MYAACFDSFRECFVKNDLNNKKKDDLNFFSDTSKKISFLLLNRNGVAISLGIINYKKVEALCCYTLVI